MKNIKIKITTILVLLAAIYSCEPRIEMDMAQWGDHAYLDNVQLFTLQVEDSVKLVEWYESGQVVTGVRQIIISKGNAVTDSAAFTTTVTLKPGESLDMAGFIFYHHATHIEPLEGAPKAGVISDLNGGPFKYRLYSADGSEHDWTIYIEQ